MSAGKGSGRRPQLAPDEQVSDNWSNIFGITCRRCGKRGLQPDSVHTCSPQINDRRKPIKTQEQMHEWLNVALKDNT